ncbi:hypothetical protein EG68_12455 [Paragonimus skrjabini miyazakii]|uniref:Uncharacterized protein n=1 Tax=Paragonimus skrjabini miyazakii TaxID=59628 RepID=A0A8S9YGH1_9TREM|nr:hypothetical protein EG68_12455 [Paragonimus skrjabini miyazakii]
MSTETDVVEKADKLFRIVDKRLHTILRNDRFLCDLLPSNHQIPVVQLPSVKSVQNAIALHYGRAIRLTLLRGDGVELPLVLSLTARVVDLYAAVKEAVMDYLTQLSALYGYQSQSVASPLRSCARPQQAPSESNMEDIRNNLLFTSPKFISWKKIWKTKCLAVINADAPKPPLSAPSIFCRLDNPKDKLQDLHHIRNGSMVTFVNRLKRK